MLQIKKLLDKDIKMNVAKHIIRQLPEWFGIEEAIVDYINGTVNSDFYAAYDSDKPLGFISIKANNEYTSEIYVMGILKEYHNRGIGRKLLKSAEDTLIKNKVKFLMVKTLGESDLDINYRITREFYKSMGFYPLEEIKEIWGEDNPCLIMIKSL